MPRMSANVRSCRQGTWCAWETSARGYFQASLSHSSGVAAVSNQFAVHNDSEQSSPQAPSLNPLYLFVSYLEWRIEGNLASLGELLAALADANEEVRLVAKSLITENSPRPSSA